MKRRLLLATAVACLAATAAVAQPFPSKPLHLIVPVPAGGPTDLLARRLGEKLAASLGQPVIVENRAGAGGMLGAAAVAKSPPDGHTLLVGFSGIVTIGPALYKSLPLDPLRELAPVTMLVSAPLVIGAHPAGKLKSLDDLARAARAQAGFVNYGSSGNGSSMHLTGELLAQAVGAKLTHVPYRGSAASLQDLMGQQIDTAISDLPFYLPHVQGGRVLPLAVTSARRHPLLPAVPAVAELHRGFETTSWQGLFAPAGTPAAVIERLNREAVAAIRSPDLRAYFVGLGYTIETGSPADFAAFLRADHAKWAKVIKDAGVVPE